MGLSLLSRDKIIAIVEKRLLEGWIIGTGDPECIDRFGDAVYPLGTSDVVNFELVMIPSDPPRVFFLAKKTPKLREAFRNLSDKEFEDLFYIEFTNVEDKDQCPVHVELVPPERRRKAIVKMLERLKNL